MVSFTHPESWKCFKSLCDLYPRNIGASKVFRITVEEALQTKNKKGSQSITDFACKYAFNLDSDLAIWKASIKSMSPIELTELAKLLKKREGLVSEELYKRLK